MTRKTKRKKRPINDIISYYDIQKATIKDMSEVDQAFKRGCITGFVVSVPIVFSIAILLIMYAN